MPEQPCAFHPDRPTGVSCSRCDRPICPDDMFPAAVGIHCPICAGKMREGALGRTGYEVRARVDHTPLGRMLARAEMTSIILAANVIVFVLMLATGKPTSGQTLYRFGAMPDPLPASEWWRLFTAMFVHIGFAHIAFNMFALVIFGGSLEQRYGRARFLGLYLVSGLLGNAVSLSGKHFGVSAGASGAIFGILGAWVAFAFLHRNVPSMRGQMRSWAVLIGINLFFSVATPNIDARAHIGGLLGGAIIAAGLELSAKRKGPQRAATAVAGYAAVVVVALLLIVPNLA